MIASRTSVVHTYTPFLLSLLSDADESTARIYLKMRVFLRVSFLHCPHNAGREREIHLHPDFCISPRFDEQIFFPFEIHSVLLVAKSTIRATESRNLSLRAIIGILLMIPLYHFALSTPLKGIPMDNYNIGILCNILERLSTPFKGSSMDI